jgi:G:T-mismatch repair DNA endonuclease (very short patch repair protein)
VARDRKALRRLTLLGWSVLRFWEHDLRSPQRVLRRLARANLKPSKFHLRA